MNKQDVKKQIALFEKYIESLPEKSVSAQHRAHLTALRRGLAVSLLFNVLLLAVVLVIIGGR